MTRCKADKGNPDKYGATGPNEVNIDDPTTWTDEAIIRDIAWWRKRNGDPEGAKRAFALATRIGKNSK